jgi:hypothetical protein
VLDAPPSLIAAVGRAMAKIPDERYPSMDAFRRDLHMIHRELVGGSGMYPTVQGDTVRTIRPESSEDLETTLATPSSGVAPIHANITPPSGALARVPAPSDATPSSAALSGERPPLELVNFRDPSADAAGEDTVRRTSDTATAPEAAVGKTRMMIFGVLAAVIAGVAAYFYLGRAPAPAPRLAPTPAPAVPTPALEFPEPRLGTGEAPAVPAPPAPAVPVPTAVSAAPAKKFKVQFSSVPVATLSVDGEKIGPSIPARTLSLEEGEHSVRLEAPGFPPHEKKFHVGSRSENRIHYQFPVSMLVIQAPGWAGARVLVDGKYRGSLPDAARLRLPAGSYSITLSREGSNPVTEKIDVPEGSPKTWNAPPPSREASGGP